jgi:hypothetical protein
MFTHDIVVRRQADGGYVLKEWIRGIETTIEGPMSRARAEARALELSDERGVDAWSGDASDIIRLL